MFKGKTDKLDTKSKLCYFIGYSKGTKYWLFYDPKEQIVLVSTDIFFLRIIILVKELFDTPREPLERSYNLMEAVSKITISPLLDTREPCCSGGLSGHLDRFMSLEKAISNEHDLDPSSYNKTSYDRFEKLAKCYKS